MNSDDEQTSANSNNPASSPKDKSFDLDAIIAQLQDGKPSIHTNLTIIYYPILFHVLFLRTVSWQESSIF